MRTLIRFSRVVSRQRKQAAACRAVWAALHVHYAQTRTTHTRFSDGILPWILERICRPQTCTLFENYSQCRIRFSFFQFENVSNTVTCVEKINIGGTKGASDVHCTVWVSCTHMSALECMQWCVQACDYLWLPIVLRVVSAASSL